MSSINHDEDSQTIKTDDITKYFKQTKKDFETMNKSLINNVETIDSENQRLKEAISELLSDLKDKDASLDQSQKIIAKLKEEYSKLIQEYQDLKTYSITLEEEIDFNRKEIDNLTRNHHQYEKSARLNESFRVEVDKLRKEVLNLKTTKTTKIHELSKREKENTDKELVITSLQKKTENWIGMIKERDRLLEHCDMKIRELTEQLEEKNEQLRLLMNFSKDINNENKTNVKELTKQAVQTMKLLYMSINPNNNNHSNSNYNADGSINESVSRIELIEDDSCIKVLVDCIQNNKCTFLLEDALKSNMYMPYNAKSIPKEYLFDMNFKSELIKYELMSSLIRESHIVSFLDSMLSKLDIKVYASFEKSTKGSASGNTISNEILSKMLLLKSNYERECKRSEALSKDNQVLNDKVNELLLYIQKSKEEFEKKMGGIKQKVETLEKYYLNQIKMLQIVNGNMEESIKVLKARKIKEEVIKVRDNRNDNNDNDNDDNRYDEYQPMKTQMNRSMISSRYKYKHQSDNEEDGGNNGVRWKRLRKCKCDSITIKPVKIIKAHDSNNNNDDDCDEDEEDIALINRRTQTFNESYYNNKVKAKREETEQLKEEVSMLKNEITSLMSELHQARIKAKDIAKDKDKEDIIKSEYQKLNNGIIGLKDQIPLKQLNDICNYFINFTKELDKVSSNTDDIVSNLSLAETKFSHGNQDKKIKMSSIHGIFIEMNKLFSILLNLLSRFSNDIKVNTLSLKTIFDFLEQYVYITNSPISSPRFFNKLTPSSSPLLNKSQSQSMAQYKPSKSLKNHYEELNLKVFPSSELMKYKALYNTKTISSLITIFKIKLSEIKKEIEGIAISNHSSVVNTESEGDKGKYTQTYANDNNNNNTQYNRRSNIGFISKNEELLQMKREIRDGCLMNELIKHFLVVNERIHEIRRNKHIEDDEVNDIGLNCDLYNELYYLFEEAFNYKIDYMTDDAIFNRRLLSQLLKGIII